MKKGANFLRVIVLVLVFILAILPLTSCGEGVTKAKDTIQGFCTALENGDAETALTFMHPSCEITEDELITSIIEIEESYNVSFADGYTIVLFREPSVNYSLSFPNGLVGTVSIKLDMIVSGQFLTASVVVLEADGAVGITSFKVSKSDEADDSEDNADNNESSDTTNSI